MKLLEPKSMRRVTAGAACSCICSSGSAYAKQAGGNAGVCGCYCSGNNDSNFNKADATEPNQ